MRKESSTEGEVEKFLLTLRVSTTIIFVTE